MNGSEKDTTTLTALEFETEITTAFHTLDVRIADVALRIGELIRELGVEIGAVGDQHNSRRAELHALHQQAREE